MPSSFFEELAKVEGARWVPGAAIGQSLPTNTSYGEGTYKTRLETQNTLFNTPRISANSPPPVRLTASVRPANHMFPPPK